MKVKSESFFCCVRNWVILERYMMKLNLEMKVTRFLLLSHSQIDICVFFQRGKKVIVTNGFRKRGRKMPRNEKELALKNMADYLVRHLGEEE